MKDAYDKLKRAINRKGGNSGESGGSFGELQFPLIEKLHGAAAAELSGCAKLELISKVQGKTYFQFKRGGSGSRPVNRGLFNPDHQAAFATFAKLLEGRRHELDAEVVTRDVYSVVMACCAARDVVSSGDQKTPGTIFEWLCAALIQACLNVRPVRSLPVLNLDLHGSLPTDLVFDLGEEKPKFHVPVKTSTRERIIQVWAHQRVLDGVYGSGRFLALPIVLAETKLDSKKLEVTEICLPFQWGLYQMHIAALWNVCYLDAPKAYLNLDTKFPRIGVSTLGDLLSKGGRLDDLLDFHKLL